MTKRQVGIYAIDRKILEYLQEAEVEECYDKNIFISLDSHNIISYLILDNTMFQLKDKLFDESMIVLENSNLF